MDKILRTGSTRRRRRTGLQGRERVTSSLAWLALAGFGSFFPGGGRIHSRWWPGMGMIRARKESRPKTYLRTRRRDAQVPSMPCFPSVALPVRIFCLPATCLFPLHRSRCCKAYGAVSVYSCEMVPGSSNRTPPPPTSSRTYASLLVACFEHVKDEMLGRSGAFRLSDPHLSGICTRIK